MNVTEFWRIRELLRMSSDRFEARRAKSRSQWKALALKPEHVYHGNLAGWNGWADGRPQHIAIGSQNHPQHSAASVGYWEWLAELASVELQEGLYSREAWSWNYYFAGPMAAKMAAYHWARQAKDDYSAQLLRRWLRSVWTCAALAAVRGNRFSEFWWRGDMDSLMPRAIAHQDYLGAYVAAAGQRIETGGATAKFAATQPDYLLSWALDLHRSFPPRNNISVGPDRLYGQVFAELLGVASYQEPTSGDPWGLEDFERETLCRVVDGDSAAAREACSWLRRVACSYQPNLAEWHQVHRIRRTSAGVEMATTRATHGSKAGMQLVQIAGDSPWPSWSSLLAMGNRTRAAYAAVDHTNADGANRGWRVNETPGEWFLEGATASGKLRTMVIPKLGGELLWDISLTPDGPTLHHLDDEAEPPPEPPPDETAPPGRWTVNHQMAHGFLAQLVREYSSGTPAHLLTGTLGEVVNRLGGRRGLPGGSWEEISPADLRQEVLDALRAALRHAESL